MATKKAAKAEIEKASSTTAIGTLTLATTDLLGKYAQVLSQEALAPKDLIETFRALRDIKAVLEDKNSGLETVAKAKVIAFLKGYGKPFSEKGGMEATVGGMLVRMHPSRTGYDAKKVEALLRSKGKEPSAYMQQEVRYTMPEANTMQMEKLRKLLGDEMESCQYEESWTVSTPK